MLLVFQKACQILQSLSQHLCPVTPSPCIFKALGKFDGRPLEAMRVCALSAQLTRSRERLDEDVTSAEMDIQSSLCAVLRREEVLNAES